MLVAGSMIGSGNFYRLINHWAAGGRARLVTCGVGCDRRADVNGRAFDGELAAMMPKAGGQYVYLREAFSPLWGFLYGWTLFLVIQTGTIAAVAVGFARYMGVLVPWVSESNYLIRPIRLGGYAISLSTAQLVGLLLIALLTFMNTLGLKLGKIGQNIFTTAKTGALIALILLGIVVGLRSGAGAANFSDFWSLRGGLLICAGCGKTKSTDELIADLKSGQERDRIIAVRLLPQQKVDAAKIVPAMIECLKDKQGDVRLSAAIGLGSFGEEARLAIPELQAAENDRDARVRRAAGVALSRIDPKLAPKTDPIKRRGK